MLSKAAQTSRAARYGLLASAAVDGTIAVYRGKEGWDAVQNEQYLLAATKFADVALRLIGVGVNTAAYLKAVGKTKVAAQAATEQAAKQAEFKAAAQAAELADHGHSLARHGPEVTDEALMRRVTQGIAPDEVFSPYRISTRFNDYETWLKTRDAALQKIRADSMFRQVPGPGDQIKFIETIKYDNPTGSGFAGREGTQHKITFGTKTGKVYDEVDPIITYYVKTAIEWDSENGVWKVVQHIPTASP